jgi:hypothetical protein
MQVARAEEGQAAGVGELAVEPSEVGSMPVVIV